MEEWPPGRGASVSLRFTAACKEAPQPASVVNQAFTSTSPTAAAVEPEAEPVQAVSCATGRPKILFMDDEPEFRDAVSKILTTHECQTICTSTGEKDVEAYFKSINDGDPFDMLLLNLEVNGGIGGKDTVAILRQDFPNIKALVTTGYLDDAVTSNHREYGFSGVITKPFQIAYLVSMLNILGGPTA